MVNEDMLQRERGVGGGGGGGGEGQRGGKGGAEEESTNILHKNRMQKRTKRNAHNLQNNE